MIIGIDMGYSSTKIVVLNKSRIIHKQLIEYLDKPRLEKLVRDVILKYKDVRKICITGGKSRLIKLRFSVPVKHVDELKATGTGSLFLAGKQKGIVVSCGTGTAVINANENNFDHLGGTGVGGGTILGLSKRMLSITDVKRIEALAKRGFLSKTDIQVGEIAGGSVGVLPKNITASNFGKLVDSKKEDVAKAILNLVAEVIATTAIFAARSANQSSVFLAGRVIKIKYVYSRIKVIGGLFKISMLRLPQPEYATAVGAALLAR